MNSLILSTVHFELGALSWLQVSQELQDGVQEHPAGVNQEFTATRYGSDICNTKTKPTSKSL